MKTICKVRLACFVLNFLVNTVYSAFFVLVEILLVIEVFLGVIAPCERGAVEMAWVLLHRCSRYDIVSSILLLLTLF